MKRLYFTALILLATTLASAQPTPVPSYTLPPSGWVQQFGPGNGWSTTYFWDYGQSSVTFGPGGQPQFQTTYPKTAPPDRWDRDGWIEWRRGLNLGDGEGEEE